MKIKCLAIIALFLAATFGMAANEKKFSISDVEYLKGEDFVQLRFVTDTLIPIPDLFYPDESNAALIVMRVTDVDFNMNEDVFKFDSPIISRVAIKKKDKYTDVKIRLKEQVNYRVFTNHKGLFVEFPNMKRVSSPAGSILAKKDTPAPPPTEKKKRKKAKTPPVIKSPTAAPPARTSPPVKKTAPKPTPTPTPTQVSHTKTGPFGPAVIKNFEMTEKNANQLKFEFQMTGKADYEVIPIPESPVRLAIDFKNTRARKISKNVNHLNVMRIRGALNSPSVYRVVFDLKYLKNYNVSYDGNVMVVEFFDQLPQKPINKELHANLQGKKTSTPPAEPVQPPVRKPIDLVSKDAVPTTPTPEDEDITPDPESKPPPRIIDNEVVDEAAFKPDIAPPANSNVKMGRPSIEQPQDDFFAEEKSRISPAAYPPQEAPMLMEERKKDETDNEQLNSLKRTIQEGRRKYYGEPMDFNFKDAELDNVLLFFAKISGLSIVIDPKVSGKVTARMYQVPWDQALDYFLRINSLDMVLEGNLLRIGKLDVLAKEANARAELEAARQKAGEIKTITRTLSYTKVGDMAAILETQLTKRGSIIMDRRSNTLIISEAPSRLSALDQLIDTLDVANPQVSIEARMVETFTNYTRSLGIQWGYGFTADSMYGNQTSLKFPNSISVSGNQLLSDASPFVGPLNGYAVNLPATGANTGTMFSLGNISNTFRLDVALSAMENRGQGRVISAPKTTTQNNMEAQIQQGKQIPVQTIQNNTVTVRYTPAAIELRVTPQITAKGTIICAIELKNNSADFANLVNGIPPITSQTIRTTVMIEDGGTIVIGGIYKIEDSNSRAGTPFFSKIPILGNLFKNSNRRSEQREFLVFITPRIIK